MPFFTQRVSENRIVHLDYVVEAANEEEAENKIALGEGRAANEESKGATHQEPLNVIAECPANHFIKQEDKALLAALTKIIASYGENFMADEGIDEAVCEQCSKEILDKAGFLIFSSMARQVLAAKEKEDAQFPGGRNCPVNLSADEVGSIIGALEQDTESRRYEIKRLENTTDRQEQENAVEGNRVLILKLRKELE